MSSPIKRTQLCINFQGITFLYSDWSRSLGVQRRRKMGALEDRGRSENSVDNGGVEYGWECWTWVEQRGSGGGVTTGETGEAGKNDVHPGRTECSCFITKSAQKNSNRPLCTLGRKLHERCWECVGGRKVSVGTGGEMKRGRTMPSPRTDTHLFISSPSTEPGT